MMMMMMKKDHDQSFPGLLMKIHPDLSLLCLASAQGGEGARPAALELPSDQD